MLQDGSQPLQANPQGMSVQSGAAAASANGSTLTITAANNTHLNWQSFDIAPGETTLFQQPSSSSIVWNNIGGQSASQIYGSLQANGVVVLVNSSGFYFGPNSFVKAAGLVISTANGMPVFGSGGAGWQFNGPPPTAGIVNYGQISAAAAGFVYLLGASIDNHGTITAPSGSIGLCAGQTVLLSERPDGRGLSAQVTLPTGAVNNSGRLIADAGSILARAKVVNQNGIIQAESVRSVNGVVELCASESLTLGADSVIRADGQSAGDSGGSITIKSQGSFADAAGSLISSAGASGGGNGGLIEVSAAQMPSLLSTIDAHAFNGVGGKLFLDPTDINIGNSGSGSAGSGTVGAGSPPATLNLDLNSAFIGFSEIDLQATRNIALAANALWDLDASTGTSGSGRLLKLEAGNNITLGNGSSIVAADGWSVTLEAGRNFAAPDAVVSGTGSITFSGTAGLQAANGAINLLAGNSVTVNSGYVRTVDGGSITVAALSGSIKTGTNPNGYDFRSTDAGYVVDPNLGGISTAAGGNVTLTAGTDITSYLPIAGAVQSDAGSGCFGAAPGNVTINAGRDVAGHFVVANGTGTITAGHNAGISTRMLALSLVSGGWNVTAANDILLQEVRNPNGIFNNLGAASSPLRHYFDYSADACVDLNAGHGVQLIGTALPRYNDSFESSIPCIYPPTLNISAGAGGVALGNDVILFPSSQGWLGITTTLGGGLTSTKTGSDLAQLILSDSGKDQYLRAGDFGLNDHASVPVHINDSRALELNIDGSMQGIFVVSAERAEINVVRDLLNCRFDGQNLHSGDVTFFKVGGAIRNRSEFTSLTLDGAPDFTALGNAYPPLTGALANLASLFYYDAAARTLTFQGRMTTDEYQALQNLTVQAYDAYGQPILDGSGNPVTQPAQFISPAALQALYAASQNIPNDPTSGFRIGGGGTFKITAASLDLGATAGLLSEGPAENSALAKYFTRGADIDVSLAGDLDMFSTTISCVNGGTINVSAGGNIDLGSAYFQPSDNAARGIFSTRDSDVTVVAGGDIQISGSRIAAFDGGDVTVRSLHGNVAVGAGGQGAVEVEEIYVDPQTRKIVSYIPTIPQSGILATTFPQSGNPAFPTSKSTVGNILVETPQGDITTHAAGIEQIPYNGSSATAGAITLTAGSKDAAGHVLYAGNIDLSGTGVIGNNIKVSATGTVTGAIIARSKLDIDALGISGLVAFTPGTLTIHAQDIDQSKLIGIQEILAVGDVRNSDLLSQLVSTTGQVTGSQVGFAAGTAANATSQGLSLDLAAKTLSLAEGASGSEEDAGPEAEGKPHIQHFTGRVTVLPPQ